MRFKSWKLSIGPFKPILFLKRLIILFEGVKNPDTASVLPKSWGLQYRTSGQLRILNMRSNLTSVKVTI